MGRTLSKAKSFTSLHVKAPGGAILITCTPLPAFGTSERAANKVSGAAFASTHDNSQFLLRVAMVLPSSAITGTGSGGRVMLQSGSGLLSRVARTVVQFWDLRPGETAVIRHRGRSDLEVEKQKYSFFKVVSKLIVALVKGTSFTALYSVKASSFALRMASST